MIHFTTLLPRNNNQRVRPTARSNRLSECNYCKYRTQLLSYDNQCMLVVSK